MIKKATKTEEKNKKTTKKAKKDNLFEQEEKRLTTALQNKNIDIDKLNVAYDLIRDIAFMTVKTAELKEQIQADGMIETYQNGANQYGKKKSSAFECYCLFTKQKSALIKQLTDLLPEDIGGNNTVADDFDEFLNARGK